MGRTTLDAIDKNAFVTSVKSDIPSCAVYPVVVSHAASEKAENWRSISAEF